MTAGPADRAVRVAAAADAIVRPAVPRVAPAVALVVLHDGARIAEAAWGVGDPAHGTPATPDLRFDLASVTKLVTTTLVLRLAGAGRLDLDDPVVAYVPELAGPRPPGTDGGQDPFTLAELPGDGGAAAGVAPAVADLDPAAIRVRHLLAHTGGLVPWRALFLAAGPVPPEPPAADPVGPEARRTAVLAAIGRARLAGAAGAVVRYSDLGFILLGEIARRVGGRPLDAAVASGVAAPLGCATLGWTPRATGLPRSAVAPTSLDARWRGRRAWGEVEDENAAGLGGVAGHAGLFAAARDVAAFGEAWRTTDPRLGVDPALAADALRVHGTGPDLARGLGWELRSGGADGYLDVLGPGAYGHTGFTGTSLAIDPGRGLVIACLANRGYAERRSPHLAALLPRLHAAIARAVDGE